MGLIQCFENTCLNNSEMITFPNDRKINEEEPKAIQELPSNTNNNNHHQLFKIESQNPSDKFDNIMEKKEKIEKEKRIEKEKFKKQIIEQFLKEKQEELEKQKKEEWDKFNKEKQEQWKKFNQEKEEEIAKIKKESQERIKDFEKFKNDEVEKFEQEKQKQWDKFEKEKQKKLEIFNNKKKEEMDKIEKENQQIQEKAKNVEKQKMDLEKNKKEFQIKKNNFEKEKEQFKSKEKQFNEKNEKFNKREEEIIQKENKINKAEDDLKIKENDFNKRNIVFLKKNEEILKTKEEIKKAKDEFQLKEKELNDKNKSLENKKKILDELENNLKKEKENIKLLQNELEEKKNSIRQAETLNEENIKLTNKLKKEKEENEKQKEQNNKIKKENEKFKKEKEKYFEDKEANIKIRENAIVKKEQKLLEKENEINNKENRINNKEKEINNKEDIVNNKEKSIKIKEIEINKKIYDYELKRKQDEDEYNKKNQQLIIKEKDLIRREDSIIWSKKPILVGLNNIGATCYMNATLQCLSNTKKLTEYFLKTYKDNSNNVMANEYHKVLSNLWRRENHNKAYSPNSFKETLSQENPLFAGIQANDSKDLINFLIERFHQELNIIKKNPNNNITMTQEDQTNEQMMLQLFLNEFAQNFNSPISNLFYGILETKSQCQGCKVIKFNFQIYSFLEFPLQQVNQFCFNNGKRPLYTIDGKNPDVNLYECFDYNGKVDLMSGDNQMYCNICNKLNNSLYASSIYSLPIYLIINLNRGKGAVYECKVNFPEQLNLYNYASFKDGYTVYGLYAVICHLGPSSMSGHFVAYCRNRIDNKWYLYNDGIVTSCTRPQQYKDGMPYILFYKALTIE